MYSPYHPGTNHFQIIRSLLDGDELRKKSDEEAYQKITKNLQRAEVDVKAIFGEANITIEEFLKLSREDIIALDKAIDSPLTLVINDKPKFFVQPGNIKIKCLFRY